MGFWKRWFGDNETAAQKLERARFHLDDNEPMLAARIVERLTGPEADEIRSRARALVDGHDREHTKPVPRDTAPAAYDLDHAPDADAPIADDPYRRAPSHPKSAPPPQGMRLTYGTDGSTRIESAGASVTLNAPISDDDGRARSTDARAVAHRLLANLPSEALDAAAYPFVEAALVLARADDLDLSVFRDERRRAVAALARCAVTRDPGAIVHAITHAAPEVQEYVAWFATPLAASFAARELGALALRGTVRATPVLLEALVREDLDTAVRIAEALAPVQAGLARVLAEAAGVDGTRFLWRDWQTEEDRIGWLELEIQRLARTDLARALALEPQLDADEVTRFLPTFALGVALATHDPAQLAERLAVPIIDHSGWLAGAVHTRAPGIEAVLDTWIDALGPGTIDPAGHFAAVLDGCIELGDLARVRRCIAQGGPTGWQIAFDARRALAGTAERAAMLAVLYERQAPGIVAGRAIPYGQVGVSFVVGRAEIQPVWLAFSEPHPIETLALVAALGPDAPRWLLARA